MGSFLNKACVDDGATGADEVCSEVTTPKAALTLTKTDNLNPAKYDHVGQIVTYTLTAKNTGNTPLHNVTVSTTRFSGFVCARRRSRWRRSHRTRRWCAPARTRSRRPTSTPDRSPTRPRHEHRSAVARCARHDPGRSGRGAGVDEDRRLSRRTYDHVGQVVTYTLTANNTGNVTLHNVTVVRHTRAEQLQVRAVLAGRGAGTEATGGLHRHARDHAGRSRCENVHRYRPRRTRTRPPPVDAPTRISRIVAEADADQDGQLQPGELRPCRSGRDLHVDREQHRQHDAAQRDGRRRPGAEQLQLHAVLAGGRAGTERHGGLHRYAHDHAGRPRCGLVPRCRYGGLERDAAGRCLRHDLREARPDRDDDDPRGQGRGPSANATEIFAADFGWTVTTRRM